MRLLAIASIVACLGIGCTPLEEGTAVANPHPPHDVWQLAEQAVDSVPLTVAKLETLLGTQLTEDVQTPGRWVGGPVRLGPSLHVTSSVIGINDDASWNFAAIEIEPAQCVSIDMVRARYPTVELRYGVTGHSPYENFGWEVGFGWGVLGFGMRAQDDCLASLYLNPAR